MIFWVAADICFRVSGGNIQTDCEILINIQTNKSEWELVDTRNWLQVYSNSTER